MLEIFIAKYGLCIYFVVTIHYTKFKKTLEAITKNKKKDIKIVTIFIQATNVQQ